MPKNLEKARDLARRVRFSGEKSLTNREKPRTRERSVRDAFYANELCLSPEVTPGLNASLEEIYQRLGVPKDAVEAFVYSSSDLNAQCYTGDSSECVIRFSSGLIDILSVDEFQFVVGHELGHFLFEHGIYAQEARSDGLEKYIDSRAQEISADRMGLLACQSIDVAIKALLKTVSGLNSTHLRMDVGSFISQIRKSDSLNAQNSRATHPSIFVRARALLWLSMCEQFQAGAENITRGAMDVIDNRVSTDMAKYVDGAARRQISEAKQDVAIWLFAERIVASGVFSKPDQAIFEDQFGHEMLNKLTEFLGAHSVDEGMQAVQLKLENAKERLMSLAPSLYEKEFAVPQRTVQ